MKLDDYEEFVLSQVKSENDSKSKVNAGCLMAVATSLLLILAAVIIVVFVV